MNVSVGVKVGVAVKASVHVKDGVEVAVKVAVAVGGLVLVCEGLFVGVAVIAKVSVLVKVFVGWGLLGGVGVLLLGQPCKTNTNPVVKNKYKIRFINALLNLLVVMSTTSLFRSCTLGNTLFTYEKSIQRQRNGFQEDRSKHP